MPRTKKSEDNGKKAEDMPEAAEAKTAVIEQNTPEASLEGKDENNLNKTENKSEDNKLELINSDGEDKSLESLKEQLKSKKDAKSLLSLEEYVKSGIHLGTKVIMPDMRKYVYRRRADGLAILNTEIIDTKLREAAEYITKFNPKEIIVVCKREAGWKSLKLFSEVTGIRVFTKKYPAGIITNIKLANFFEPELIIICDPWLDKNALNDAKKTNKKVLALCDTNNIVRGADVIVPCNNKSEKSLGLILYIFAQELIRFHKLDTKIKLEDFTGDMSMEKPLKEKDTKETTVVNPEAQAF